MANAQTKKSPRVGGVEQEWFVKKRKRTRRLNKIQKASRKKNR